MQSLSKRIQKEITDCYNSKTFQFFFDYEGKYGELNAGYIKFTALNDMYHGQIHILRVKFQYGSNEPYVFPRNPPNVVFVTPIWHTNIQPGGSICLDVIKNEWSPLWSMETVFSAILGLLGDPNPESPYNREASAQFVDHRSHGTLDQYKKICADYYYSKIKSEQYTPVMKLLHAPEFKAEKNKIDDLVEKTNALALNSKNTV